MASNVFGSDSSSALPGGNVAKPLIIALLALFASRYFSKKGSDQTASAEPQPAPRIPQADPANASPGDILDGLGGLVKQFQQKGLGNVVGDCLGGPGLADRGRLGPVIAGDRILDDDPAVRRGQRRELGQHLVRDLVGLQFFRPGRHGCPQTAGLNFLWWFH